MRPLLWVLKSHAKLAMALRAKAHSRPAQRPCVPRQSNKIFT